MKSVISINLAVFAFTAVTATMTMSPLEAMACKPGRNCDVPGAPPSGPESRPSPQPEPYRPPREERPAPQPEPYRPPREERPAPQPEPYRPPREERPIPVPKDPEPYRPPREERPAPRPEPDPYRPPRENIPTPQPEPYRPPRETEPYMPPREERPVPRPQPDPYRPPREERPVPRPQPDPYRPPREERPAPRPQPEPYRPLPPDTRVNREGRGHGYESDARQREIEARRREMAERRRTEYDRYREQENYRNRDRQDWWNNCPYRPDHSWVNSNDYWSRRWDRWYEDTYRPPVITYPIPAPMPWPDHDHNWTMADIEIIAQNMEAMTRNVYDTLIPYIRYSPNQEYAQRAPRVLAEFADAARAYTDAVYRGTDYVDSLNELFYLESKLLLTEQTLDGYSQSYRVQDQMSSLRYYIYELLWTYRQSY